MVNDDKIKEVFFTDKGTLRRPHKIIESNKEYKNYLLNRFSDCTDYKEIIWRIRLGYETVPLCPVCKENKIKYRGTWQIGYAKTCCKECRDILWHDTQVKAVQEKYGTDNVFRLDSCKDKIKKTNLERYGYEYVLASPVERKKHEEINLKKYGVRNGGGSKQAQDKISNTCLKRYGVKRPAILPEIIDKMNATKLRNHSFRSSKQEDKVYDLLCEKYGTDNVMRQYRSIAYPFACDFYIVQEDLYIEANFYWHHGKHPFNKDNKEDVEILNKWKLKNKPSYDNAINVWTVRDVNKMNTAIRNKLNYKAFYTLSDVYDFLRNEGLKKKKPINQFSN